jgi:stage III sporulation protein AB
MLKSMGVILIFSSCGGLGLIKAGAYRRHCGLLQELLLALELLEAEIQYQQNPLRQAFEELAQRLNPQGAGKLFLVASQGLAEKPQMSPATAWLMGAQALQNIIPKDSLLPEYLAGFGQGLGKSDRASQSKLFALLRQQLQHCLADAQVQKQREEKIWQYLGFCFGAVLIIMLL